jgi:hypothetical protein
MKKMKGHKRRKLEAAGWKVGSLTDFLGLTPKETSLVDSKLASTKTTLKPTLTSAKSERSSPRNLPASLKPAFSASAALWNLT